MYNAGIKITIPNRINIFLVLKLLFIILFFNSCDNADDNSAKLRMVTANTTLSPSCVGNACSATTFKWNKVTGNPVFKNTDATRSIIVTIDTPEVSVTLILPPNEEAESDLNTFSDPYHSNFK
jgi:hypothetical protein